ncbi:MAG: tRNA dihydrouridine synthase DusB [Pseudomonadota bacterium]
MTINDTKPLSPGAGIQYRNNVLLAPMSGVTDVPFRRLAWRFGAGAVVSEMVASEAYTTGQEEMRLKAEAAGLPLHIVQLSGREPNWMGEAVRVAEGAGADVIDINMGCPSKRVTTGFSGSALMRDLNRALSLIDATVAASSVPVTLKMRLGWDESSLNAHELAKRAEDAGIGLITVHARTRCQFYKGEADWSKVAPVRAATSLPLIINGDICDAASAREALAASGADAVMIGRATYGAPWLPGQIAGDLGWWSPVETPTGQDLLDLAITHYEGMLSFYGLHYGIRNARKHLGWYLDHLEPTEHLQRCRKRAMTTDDPALVIAALKDAFNAHMDRKAA